MSVHYKFKSNLDCDTVTFDGLHISVYDLKKSIMQQKKIGKSSDFDLQITNAQTKEVYDNDDVLVPKNTSVIVARVPVVSSNKKSWDKPELPLPIDDDDLSHIRIDKLVKNADIANTNASEDDKLKTMIHQASQEYDPSKYVKSRSMTGPLPPTYTCHRCGKQGHWIKNCPTNNMDVKRSTGIPRSFMVPVDGPEHKGALLTSSGDYAVPIIDHKAYKEVKKEKPPFVKEPDVHLEPEAEIPEHLLCMFCKNLLQDAVLIPCCGNSFCDECIRQALLDSDNHECPECHETDISPDTLIPNRYLRSAVLKFKNEESSIQIQRTYQPTPIVPPPHIESPQPSPDSTVENQPAPEELTSLSIKEEVQESDEAPPGEPLPSEITEKDEVIKEEQNVEEEEITYGDEEEEDQENTEEPVSETPPGTPLADEPVDDPLETQAIETVKQEPFHHSSYHPAPYQNRQRHHYHDDEEEEDDSQPRPISTIETITNIRNKRIPMRPGQPMPPHPHFQQGMHHRERQPDYEQRNRDYHGGYDRRNHDRPPVRGQRAHHYDAGQNERYHRNDDVLKQRNRREYRDYPPEARRGRQQQHFEGHPSIEPRRHSRPQVSASQPALIIPPPGVEVARAPHSLPHSAYKMPLLVTPPNQPPASLPTSQSFPPQPPPPGASPSDHTSHIPPQPPPPGVGPPLIPSSHLQDAPSFASQTFQNEEIQLKKEEEKSLEDRLEEFQRKLDKKASESARDRSSRSSSRSRKRSRSSSSSSRSSASRSYSSSSKSWSRSSRSVSRSSRSRTPYSSRSRTRSFTRTRSRSRSKARSYSRSRSRSRSRTPETRLRRSRSRDRDRNKDRERERPREREKRHISPRERLRIPYPRNQSHSPSPRKFYPRNRPSPIQVRRPPYNPPAHHAPPPPPPLSYGNGAYPSSYTSSTSALPVPVLRTTQYSSSHLHPSMQPPPIVHPHPLEHYPVERTRYPPYEDVPYQGYDAYPHTSKPYPHQRYEREPRGQRYKPQDYHIREYPRREEEVEQHIPGWIGDRSREYKHRYRPVRDQRKETIKELPMLQEPDLKSEIRVRNQEELSVRHVKVKEESPIKKKSEKTTGKTTKHKKHHHHHVKESKMPEKTESKHISTDSNTDVSSPLVDLHPPCKVEVLPQNQPEENVIKTPVKVKEKKHKHKKHKTEEQLAKKKKVPKKEKIEANKGVEAPVKVKTKKKKNKIKGSDEVKKKDKSKRKKTKTKKVEVAEIKQEKQEDHEESNVLTTTPPPVDVKLEPNNFVKEEVADDVIKLNVSNEDLEINAPGEYDAETNYEPASKNEDNYEQDNHNEQDDLSKSKTPEHPAGKTYDQQKIDDEVDYEEEEEGLIEDENEEEEEEKERELHVDVPELSKWEREELEEEPHSRPQRRSTIIIPKEDRGALPSEIIQRAENVIMQKPLKKALTSSLSGKEKVKPEKKISIKSEILSDVSSKVSDHSPRLQVTISTDKDKQRSVQAKDEVQKQASQVRKIKLDRSSFKSFDVPSSTLRTVIEEPITIKKEKTSSQGEEQNIGVKRKHIKIHGPDYVGDSDDQDSPPHEKRKHSKVERHAYRRSRSREDTRRKKDVSVDRRHYENPEIYRTQSDVRYTGSSSYDRSRHHHSDKHKHGHSAKDSHRHRSHSESYDSPVRKKEKKKKKSKKKKEKKS